MFCYTTAIFFNFIRSPLKNDSWKTILSFWEGEFSAAMLNFQGVLFKTWSFSKQQKYQRKSIRMASYLTAGYASRSQNHIDSAKAFYKKLLKKTLPRKQAKHGTLCLFLYRKSSMELSHQQINPFLWHLLLYIVSPNQKQTTAPWKFSHRNFRSAPTSWRDNGPCGRSPSHPSTSLDLRYFHSTVDL